jgi:hypothetical protein
MLYKHSSMYNISELNKNIGQINKSSALSGYKDKELPERIRPNMEFARINMKTSIYDQVVL